MRTFKTEGIIIRRHNFKDADRIVTIFTKDYGKIAIKAIGVRKITSRRSSHIELLNHTRMTLYQSPAGFPLLTEAMVLNNFLLIKQDLDTIGLAYYVCELINGLCPEQQENRSVFTLLQKILLDLSRPIDFHEKKAKIHIFEFELLSILGYWHNGQAVPLTMDTQAFIENIMERKLRSRNIFAKLS